MKLLHVLAAAALSAVSCSTVSAADCTMDDVDGTGPPHSFYTACTNIYTETNSTLTFSDWTAMNETRLAGLKPCGEKACIDEFTKYVEVAPNCEFWGTNYRQLYNTTLQVCKKFSEGSVTVADFNAIFHDLLANTSVEFKMFMEGLDPEIQDDVAKYKAEHGNSTNTTVVPTPTSVTVVPSPSPTSAAVGFSSASTIGLLTASLALATAF